MSMATANATCGISLAIVESLSSPSTVVTNLSPSGRWALWSKRQTWLPFRSWFSIQTGSMTYGVSCTPCPLVIDQRTPSVPVISNPLSKNDTLSGLASTTPRNIPNERS